MMRNFKLFLAFLICFIFQSTLLRNFSVFGVAPNLILVLLIVFSFYFENYIGLILGVAFGMMQDRNISTYIFCHRYRITVCQGKRIQR